MHERVSDRDGGIELTDRECVDKKRWRLFCRVCFFWETFLEGTRCQSL